MRSVFGRQFGIAREDRVGRNPKARSRRLMPNVDGLEHRNLMSGGGSVILSNGGVSVTPAPTGANTVTVSYQQVGGVSNVDVNLNGTDHYFALNSVSMVYFNGTGLAGNETFTNQNTSILTVAYGGSGTNTFTGGSGTDEFIGGSGTNVFNAGSGYDILAGGTGQNVYNESATGSGMILKDGGSCTIHSQAGASGSYQVY